MNGRYITDGNLSIIIKITLKATFVLRMRIDEEINNPAGGTPGINIAENSN